MSSPIVREVTIGPCRLIQGDCLEVLPLIGRVDAVVTDPPYGIGFKYESHDDTPENYGEWLGSIITECESHCEPGSPVFVFQTMLNAKNWHAWFPREWRIYAAAKNFVQMRPVAMQYSFDPVLVWWTDGKPYAAGTASKDFFIADTASIICKKGNIEKGHPCPRPCDQMTHIIEQWVKPDGVAIDPFMGSGTTGVACIRKERQFIGIEKEPKYFDIAVKRIQQAWDLKCSELPFDEPVKPRQRDLMEVLS